jgi:hypothetical protein
VSEAPAGAARERGRRRLLAWLRTVVAGHPAPLAELDDDFASATREAGLAALVAHHGGRHLLLLRAELDAAVRSRLVVEHSGRVVDGLRAAGVPAVTLKGPAMAARFWGEVTFRPSSDVDALIAPRNYRPAQAALEAMGYERSDPYPDWYLRGWHYNLGYVPKDGTGPKVELHWSFVRPYLGRPDVAAVIAAAEDVDCDGRGLPAPRPAVQLLSAGTHLLFHDLHLRSLMDIALIAGALSAAEWDEAVAFARASSLGPALHYGVGASAAALGWTPPPLVAALRPAGARRGIAEAYLARLSPFGGMPTLAVRQLGKVATPCVSTDFPRLLLALPYSLTDRPRVLTRLDGMLRRSAPPAARRRR